MKGFLKCYYGYKNWGDELLFLGIVPYIFKRYKLTKLYVEVGNKRFMLDFLENNKDLFKGFYDKIEFIQIGDNDKYNLDNTLKFFGGGEVLTDEIIIKSSLDKKTSKKDIISDKKDKDYGGILDLSRLDKLQEPDEIELMIENAKKSSVFSFLQKILFVSKKIASKYFARAGWNYYIKYYKDIQKGNFVLLGGITTPHKSTTKLLYKLMLPKAKEIICRDEQSYKLSLNYNKNTILYDDFGRDFIKSIDDDKLKVANYKKISKKDFFSKDYILININSKIWNGSTKQKILDFVYKYSEYEKVFFPCDMNDDLHYFDILKKEIKDLILFDWTKFDVLFTLSILKGAIAGIGTRLHFLLPLQEFGVKFEPLVYAEKIQKLIKTYGVFPIEIIKKHQKKTFFEIKGFDVYVLSKGEQIEYNNKNSDLEIYVLSGKLKIIFLDKNEQINKPTKIIIPKNTNVKIEILSGSIFLLKK